MNTPSPELTHRIIGCAMKVHSALGLGLLESAYEECLSFELSQAGLHFDRQKPLPLVYETIKLECGYRVDMLVEHQVIVEVKAVDAFADVHTAQVFTYLKLSGCKLGLLINFNVPQLRDGIKRIIL